MTTRTHSPALSGTSTQFVAPIGASVAYGVISSPVGELLVLSDGEALTGLYLDGAAHARSVESSMVRDDALFGEVARQLERYFAGEITRFSLALAPSGTAFQLEVWNALTRIDYGKTISYVELARRIGRPKASRAVGSANGRNPISIVVPCHRVIAADNSLGGYAGGLERKELLLSLERKVATS